MLLLLLVLLALSGSPATAKLLHICSDVTFNIAAIAKNYIVDDPPNPTNETAILAFIDSIPAANNTQRVSGNFTVHGTYCSSAHKFSPAEDSLQVLVHGITYNNTYWSGLHGISEIYNWQLFAAELGYPTLAIDMLGYGASSHPDPFDVVQAPMQVEILHQVMQAVRGGPDAGSPLPSSATFNKHVLVGHSYGSLVCDVLLATYPRDAEALVLTGFSGTLNFNTSATVFGDLRSSALVFPERLESRLPYGYLTGADESGRESGFYAGPYDPQVPRIDFSLEDTVSVGDLFSLSTTYNVVSDFSGPVLVATGEKDALFCVDSSMSCPDILRNTGDNLFPNAVEYGYYVVPGAGHDINLHLNAPLTFGYVHDWLGKVLARDTCWRKKID